MPFDIMHAFGLVAALFIAYSLGCARRTYRDEEGWLAGVRWHLDAWDSADPLGDSSEVVESSGSSPSADPRLAWYEGYRAGQRSAVALSPGIRERMAAGAEGGREVARGRVLG